MEQGIVKDFIDRRFKREDIDFKVYNSYWFSKILSHRFPRLDIYYNKEKNYFVAYDGKSDYCYSFDNIEHIDNKNDLLLFELLEYCDTDLFVSLLKEFRN